MTENRQTLNRNLAQMLKGGVIMDVTTPEQARIAEAAGACAVMALERIPADIRAAGGVSRMSDPKMIKGIQEAVSIPVMAKCRIGHFAGKRDPKTRNGLCRGSHHFWDRHHYLWPDRIFLGGTGHALPHRRF